jgi:O-antigen ligase
MIIALLAIKWISLYQSCIFMTIFNRNAGIIYPGKERRLLILTAIFLITFFLPGAPVINNIAIALLVIFSFGYNKIAEKMALLRQRPAIIFIIIFYVLQVISAFMSQDQEHGFRILQMRVPLLLFPISLGLIYLKDSLKFRIFFIYAAVITFVALACLISSLVVYSRTNDAGFLYNDSLTDIIGKQSVYFALMVNLALFSYVYLILKNLVAAAAKKWIFISMAFLMIVHFMLASRMEISFLYGSGIVFALYYFFIVKKNKKAGFIMIGGLAVAALLFIQLFPKTINRFNELLYPDYRFESNAVESHYNMQLTSEQWNGLNIRLAIWNCGWELVKKRPLFGVSIGDKDQALLDSFKEKGFNFGIRTNKNMHSTYLDLFASMGIIGLIVFLAGFIILPIVSCIQMKDIPGGLFLVDFMLSFVTETYPDRSMGCIIFGFFLAFILSYKKPATVVA